ncbi:MAG: FAD-dependent oxidoreductase [Caldilineaceae bacterium]|nr:FAD-dependent oxidoreductase [Caldilineaceae bacterium]
MRQNSEKWAHFVVQPSPNHTPFNVIVVGAGMAGLVAARLLHDSGCQVTVVEARNRLGGRIWTDQRWGAPCDLGASWIHGADNNPLTNWSQSLGIDLAVTSDETRFVVANGQFQAEEQVQRRAWRSRLYANRAIKRQSARLQRALAAGRPPTISLADALDPLLSSRRLRPIDRRMLAWRVALAEGVQGAPADQLDLREWFPKETAMVNALPRGGYSQLIGDAAQGLTIHLDQPVQAIQYDDFGVQVTTTAGTYRGDAVVVTVPLGILKSEQLQFDPPLPAAKQQAIRRIGYGGDGVLNKIVLRFPRVFWPESHNRFLALLDEPARRGIFTSWLSLAPIVQAPVLMSFTDGHTGAAFDRNATDEEVLQQAMLTLQRMFGQPVPEPVDFIFTRWLSDTWALGSYSYPIVGNNSQDRLTYAEPLADRLYFAGEATHLTQYGTVHAALESGAAAAMRIAETHLQLPSSAFTPPWRTPPTLLLPS